MYDSFIVFGYFVTKSIESLGAVEFQVNVHLFEDFENFEKSNEFSGVSPIGVPCFLLVAFRLILSQLSLKRGEGEVDRLELEQNAKKARSAVQIDIKSPTVFDGVCCIFRDRFRCRSNGYRKFHGPLLLLRLARSRRLCLSRISGQPSPCQGYIPDYEGRSTRLSALRFL